MKNIVQIYKVQCQKKLRVSDICFFVSNSKCGIHTLWEQDLIVLEIFDTLYQDFKISRFIEQSQ